MSVKVQIHERAPFFLQEHSAFILDQLSKKIKRSQELLGTKAPPKRALSPEMLGDRARLDLRWENGKLGILVEDGFWELEGLDSVQPEILEGMALLRKLSQECPFSCASFRLRSGMGGFKGLWVDGANVEIHQALESMKWIQTLEDQGFLVELGQKHKTARRQMEPRAWMASYNVHGTPLPLLSTIASFSQPGPEANRALISTGFDLLWDAPESLNLDKHWIEFGAGVGNLSAAFSSFFEAPGLSLESDPRMFELLEQNAQKFFPKTQVRLERAEDFDPEFLGERASAWILDPPRSGFPQLLEKLLSKPNARPDCILVYHCHEKGLGADIPILKAAGFQLHDWSLVDVFPGTTHAEVVSLFIAG